jgi:hypothetical protein
VLRRLAVGLARVHGAPARTWRLSLHGWTLACALGHRIQDTSGNFSLLREKDRKDAIGLFEGESFALSLPTENLN